MARSMKSSSSRLPGFMKRISSSRSKLGIVFAILIAGIIGLQAGIQSGAVSTDQVNSIGAVLLGAGLIWLATALTRLYMKTASYTNYVESTTRRARQHKASRSTDFANWLPGGGTGFIIIVTCIILLALLVITASFFMAPSGNITRNELLQNGLAIVVVVPLSIIVFILFMTLPLFFLTKLMYWFDRNGRVEEAAERHEDIEAERASREWHRQREVTGVVERRLNRGERPHLGADGEMVFDKPSRAGQGRKLRRHHHGA